MCGIVNVAVRLLQGSRVQVPSTESILEYTVSRQDCLRCSDLLLFANSIGVLDTELNLAYEHHPQFAPFPSWPIQLAFKGTHDDVIDFYKTQKSVTLPGVPFLDPTKGLDGEVICKKGLNCGSVQ